MLPRNILRISLLSLVLATSGCAVQTYDGKTFHHVYSQEPEKVYAYLHNTASGYCTTIGHESIYLYCMNEIADPLDLEAGTLPENQRSKYYKTLGQKTAATVNDNTLHQPAGNEPLVLPTYGYTAVQDQYSNNDPSLVQPQVLYSLLD